MQTEIYVGTSGWHYSDWVGTFYPADVKGYKELTYHSQHFNTVENNSSFYRISRASTYETWAKMTPENYKFSIKLNKFITHIHRLELTQEVETKIQYILDSTQVLKHQLGAIVIQLPPSFKLDLERLEKFLDFFTREVAAKEYKFDVAIEFRNKVWFVSEVYSLLKRYDVALVAAQSSRYPGVREVTADSAYIRMHGPEKLFASKYSTEQLQEWADYIRSISKDVKRVYVYFNNDFYGYAIENAKELMKMLSLDIDAETLSDKE